MSPLRKLIICFVDEVLSARHSKLQSLNATNVISMAVSSNNVLKLKVQELCSNLCTRCTGINNHALITRNVNVAVGLKGTYLKDTNLIFCVMATTMTVMAAATAMTVLTVAMLAMMTAAATVSVLFLVIMAARAALILISHKVSFSSD